MTGKRGIIGGWRFWLLRTLRYLAMFLDGSNRSCRSWNSFSYLLGSFSHVPRSLDTGARLSPLHNKHKHTHTGEVTGNERAVLKHGLKANHMIALEYLKTRNQKSKSTKT